jgi:hypothetical protein
MSKKIVVQMTGDLTLIFDFNNRVLDIVTNGWIIRERTKDESKPKERDEFPSNKKVRASKAETQFEKFIQVFELLSEYDPYGEGVAFSDVRKNVLGKRIATTMKEINKLLNDALTKDLIEPTSKVGFYKMKEEVNQK